MDGPKKDGYYDYARPEMLEFVPKSCRRVLEVGCASGSFGLSLKERSAECEVWGIEPVPGPAAAAAGKLDRVINATFSEALPELTGELFDAICLFDVLEHVTDPEKVLDDARKFLAHGGVIVASIPNILHFYQISEILTEQDWRYRDDGILDSTHLRFFTKKSIYRLIQSCGYEVMRLEGIRASFGLKYRLANLLLLGRLRDWRYVQFAVQARIADQERVADV